MKRRILFVGHSDTRLVPLCAAIMKYLCINKDIDNMEFSSGGFWAVEGQGAVPDLLTSAGEIGIDLSEHKAHYVTLEDMESANLIIPQDAMVARGVSSALGDQKDKLHRPMCVYDPSNHYIRAFRQSREECVEFCEKLLKKLVAAEKTREKIASSIVYRPVQSEEAAMVLPLETACFSHPWTLDNIQSEIEKETSIFLGAFHEEKMVGYASCYVVHGTAYMNNVGVHPDYRQMGIGETLIVRLEDLAREQNADVLTLEVRSKNTVAIAMYEKLGYKQHGVRRFFYRDPVDDGNIMTKTLVEVPKDDGIIRFQK